MPVVLRRWLHQVLTQIFPGLLRLRDYQKLVTEDRFYFMD